MFLKHHKQDEVKIWFESQGKLLKNMCCIPLTRYILLDNIPENMYQSSEEYESNDRMFPNCVFYCSGHQFITLIPPLIHPWTVNSYDKWMARVYNLLNNDNVNNNTNKYETATFIEDHSQLSIQMATSHACFDPLNNIIWLAYLQSDFAIHAFKNNGPTSCFYEIADKDEINNDNNNDNKEEKNQ